MLQRFVSSRVDCGAINRRENRNSLKVLFLMQAFCTYAVNVPFVDVT